MSISSSESNQWRMLLLRDIIIASISSIITGPIPTLMAILFKFDLPLSPQLMGVMLVPYLISFVLFNWLKDAFPNTTIKVITFLCFFAVNAIIFFISSAYLSHVLKGVNRLPEAVSYFSFENEDELKSWGSSQSTAVSSNQVFVGEKSLKVSLNINVNSGPSVYRFYYEDPNDAVMIFGQLYIPSSPDYRVETLNICLEATRDLFCKEIGEIEYDKWFYFILDADDMHSDKGHDYKFSDVNLERLTFEFFVSGNSQISTRLITYLDNIQIYSDDEVN